MASPRAITLDHLGPAARRQAQAAFIAQPEQKAKGNKFGANTVVVDGYRFSSEAESRRYLVLKQEQADGLIADLRLQPAFRIEIKGRLICDYVADFSYLLLPQRNRVIEDVKSKATRTPAYLLKKKMVEAQYGVTIVEVS